MRSPYPLPLFMIVLLFFSSCAPQQPSSPDELSSDASLKQLKTSQELQSFLKDYQQTASSPYIKFGGPMVLQRTSALEESAQAADSSGAPAPSQSKGAGEYSQTNVQVEGVDEADFVKNDGKHIYMVHNNELLIVDAYPPTTADILAKVPLEGNAQQLFLNGDRVAVFSSYYGSYDKIQGLPGVDSSILPPVPARETTLIHLFDVSNRKKPVKITTLTAPGNYYQSRMIGEYVYLVSQESIPTYDPGYPIPLPAIRENERVMATSPVFYFDVYMPQLVFNHITAFNVNNYEDIGLETLMMGYANTLYMSENNLFIAHQKDYPYRYYMKQSSDQEDKFFTVVVPVLPNHIRDALETIRKRTSDPYERMQKVYETYQDLFNKLSDSEKQRVLEDVTKALTDYEEKLQEERQKTFIHRFSLDKTTINYEGKGEVKGQLLNQFSLDEHNNYLRVATTFYLYGGRTTSYNNVYVLDQSMKTVGSLERVAEDERIYSTRFIGDRLYMVTFRQVDPFFVIDLTQPDNPQILGALKIPGFSDYLHPYDANHIIGVGKETGTNQWGGIQTEGLKLALFDVSDVSNPRQRAKYVIGGQGSHSEALYDHKAFLFDKKRNLLVLPVQEINDMNWSNTWNGAYALEVTPDDGFVLLGKIDHSSKNPQYQWNPVRRSLFMDDVLYTISQLQIKMNQIPNVEKELGAVHLPEMKQPIVYYGITEPAVR